MQGGIYEDLRLESLDILKNIGFDGYAIGGLAVGESQKQMFDVLNKLTKSGKVGLLFISRECQLLELITTVQFVLRIML